MKIIIVVGVLVIVLCQNISYSWCSGKVTPIRKDWRFNEYQGSFRKFSLICRDGYLYWVYKRSLLSLPALNGCEQLIRCRWKD
jgi:hypothetical protein